MLALLRFRGLLDAVKHPAYVLDKDTGSTRDQDDEVVPLSLGFPTFSGETRLSSFTACS